MIKLTYIISDINKALAFEWISQQLDKNKFQLNFILINQNESAIEKHLNKLGIPCKRISPPNHPNKWGLSVLFFKIWFNLLITRPNIVHTHLRLATLLGIPASFFAGIRKRIYTRHHSSYNHKYFPHAIKYDVWISKLSTDIISISDAVSEVLIKFENINDKKIVKIPHGFDLEIFKDIEQPRIDKIKHAHNIPESSLTIGVIARYVEWKGIQFTIEAFKESLTIFQDAHLVLANSTGPFSETIRQMLSELPDDSYTEIIFEQDLAALYKCFDIYIHVPIDKHVEAFGQTYVEALASGIPCIFTLSGIASEFISNNRNAIVVDYQDTKQIMSAIQTITRNEQLRESLIRNGEVDVDIFNLNVFIQRLELLYEN